MSRPAYELAGVLQRFGGQFVRERRPNPYHLRVLDAIARCRTASLGGHVDRCDACGEERISYNSCRNRHCPKCQGAVQDQWVERQMLRAFPVKYFHVVFTVPEAINAICQTDSQWFYNLMFRSAAQTLNAFGYSHYGVETGAICLLHTWGQNLSLHPHIHCIVPGVGITPSGRPKRIGSGGKYLYPERALSPVFRGKLMEGVKRHLTAIGRTVDFFEQVQAAWNRPWVVHCSPSLASARHVVGYLGQYTNRVAISNHRIVDVSEQAIRFSMKDYADQGRNKCISLAPVEFLRRFCLHILPKGFVKIRYYGICSAAWQQLIELPQPETTVPAEPSVSGACAPKPGYVCPFCNRGHMLPVAELPRIRSPASDWLFAPRRN
jgi:hypothetical protein